MQFVEEAEEVAVLRRGIHDSRIAERHREQAGQASPNDEDGENRRDTVAVKLRHKRAGDILVGQRALLQRFLPRHDADDREVHRHVQQHNHDDREDHRAGNRFLRLANFFAQMADVVVAQVVVNGHARGGSQAHQKTLIDVERARRKRDERRIEVAECPTR